MTPTPTKMIEAGNINCTKVEPSPAKNMTTYRTANTTPNNVTILFTSVSPQHRQLHEPDNQNNDPRAVQDVAPAFGHFITGHKKREQHQRHNEEEQHLLHGLELQPVRNAPRFWVHTTASHGGPGLV
jgi:hypothetical protein